MLNGRSFTLIRQQMAALVRRALTEVCTVPVLLVLCYSLFVYVCLCCDGFSFFFSTMPRDWLGRTSPK